MKIGIWGVGRKGGRNSGGGLAKSRESAYCCACAHLEGLDVQGFRYLYPRPPPPSGGGGDGGGGGRGIFVLGGVEIPENRHLGGQGERGVEKPASKKKLFFEKSGNFGGQWFISTPHTLTSTSAGVIPPLKTSPGERGWAFSHFLPETAECSYVFGKFGQ